MATNKSKKSINLADFLPLHLRNETNESVLKNLFNKFFSKNEAVQQIGYIGEDLGYVRDTYIGQPSLDRELNAVQPAMHLVHGNEEKVFTFNDTMNKLKLLGVDVDNFKEWGKAQGFNLYFPVNLDKFCNYTSYYWYGHLVPVGQDVAPTSATLDVNTGIFTQAAGEKTWVITHNQGMFVPVTVYTDQIYVKDGVLGENGSVAYFITDPTGALHETIPLAIYYGRRRVRAVGDISNPDPITGDRTDSQGDLVDKTGIFKITRTAQPVLAAAPFTLPDANSNIYDSDGDLVTVIGAKYYKDGKTSNVDFFTTESTDLANEYNQVVVEFSHEMKGFARVIIENGMRHTRREVLYNEDMKPDYIVMNLNATNDWARDNFWVHADDIDTNYGHGLDEMIQATRPIIEYNLGLELNNAIDSTTGKPFGYCSPSNTPAGIVTYTQSKNSRNQYPLFNMYNYDGAHSGLTSPILAFKEGAQYEEDEALGLRIVKDKYGDYTFEQSLADDAGRMYYYNESGELHSLWRKSDVYTPRYVVKTGDELVDIDPTDDVDRVGTWIIPETMIKNINHENRRLINYADLNNHFIDIMTHQVGFDGNPHGSNTFRRTLNVDPGKGGIIKDFNTQMGLFMGLINQLDSSPVSMIDFLSDQYNQSVSFIQEYVSQNIGDIIDSGVFTFMWRTYLGGMQEAVKDALRVRTLDNIFIDSTSAIPGFPVTLPYLGLAKAVQPEYKLDLETGNYVIVHHDGHISNAVQQNPALLASIAGKMYKRSDGSTSAGQIGVNPPGRPYRNQFWFNPATNELWVYLVNSDTGSPSYPIEDHEYVYDRQTNVLKYKRATPPGGQNAGFAVVEDLSEPWTLVDPAGLANLATIQIEYELYTKCPATTNIINLDAIEAAQPEKFNEIIEKDFISFAAEYGLDPYITDYSPRDPFTWNYSNVDFNGNGEADGIARWYTLYETFCGTPRPNLEPWKLVGHATKPNLWNLKYADRTGTRLWTDRMWSDIKGETPPLDGVLIGTVFTGKIPVDFTTDTLLPPYVSQDDVLSVNAMTTDIPSNIDGRYKFGDNGPIELQWRRSVAYEHDRLKTAFRLDPIGFVVNTWGDNNVLVDSYLINKKYGKKLGHRETVLHGEEIDSLTTEAGFNLTGFDVVGDNFFDHTVYRPQTFTVKLIANTVSGPVFSISGSAQIWEYRFTSLGHYEYNGLSFDITGTSFDANIGDAWEIVYHGPNETLKSTQVFKPAAYYAYRGLNQVYIQLNRYNAIDTSISLGSTILRDWDTKLIYRVGGLLDTGTLSVQTDDYPIHKNDISVVLKENHGIQDYWLNALRVQLIRRGESMSSREYHGRSDAGSYDVPRDKAADWEYRVEVFNSDNPTILFYEMDHNGAHHTFNAISGANSKDEWRTPITKGELVSRSAPFTIIGAQNVVNFLYGYVEKLTEDGWRFNKGRTPDIDNDTGRAVNWQLEIERFIDEQYKGMIPGKAVILNPFIKSVWFETPHGVVSNLKKRAFNDALATQTIFNAIGKAIDHANIRVLRTDDETEIISQEPVAGVHLILDEYEQVLVFENYVASRNERKQLLFDSFLGIKILRLHLQADIQETFTGKLTFGGHYMHGSEVRKNIESSLDAISSMYDSTRMTEGHPAVKSARGLLGYRQVPYLDTMGISDKSKFSFWKAMIHNKGSNNSVVAFLNSSRFKSAEIDEYWAYKIAEYGDARVHNYPEIKLNVRDVIDRWLRLEFTDGTPSDNTFIGVKNDDHSRWYSIDDTNSNLYFEADLLSTVVVDQAAHDGKLITLSNSGHDVIADYVTVEKETGTSDPVPVPFLMHNASTVQISLISEPLAEGERFVIKCYGPAFDRYNPCKLIDYANDVIIQDVMMWDPRRGAHTPYAKSIVDITSDQDPAKYNFSTRVVNNKNHDPLRPWGSSEVGKVWWDTQNLAYIPYNDDKIFDLSTRLARWGSLADWASIDLYEWTESTVHPSEYDKLASEQEGNADLKPEEKATGTPSRKELYRRNRTWYRRPIAWKKNNAALQQFSHNVTIIDGFAVLDTVSWGDLGVTEGMKLSNYTNGVLDGEALIVGPETTKISGSPLAIGSTVFDDEIIIEPLNNGINLTGPISIQAEPIAGEWYLKATIATGVIYPTQRLKIADQIPLISESGTFISYKFTDLGFKVSRKTISGWTTDPDHIASVVAEFVVAYGTVELRSAVQIDTIVGFTDNQTGDIFDVSFNAAAVWTDPTEDEFSADLPSPNNIWAPIYGEYKPVTRLAAQIAEIKAEADTPLMNSGDETVTRYSHSWDAWALMPQTVKRAKYDKNPEFFDDFAFDVENVTDVRVYVNGALMDKKLYDLMPATKPGTTGTKVVVKPSVSDLFRLGDDVMMVIPPPNIAKNKLDFDPLVKDDPSIMIQYKYDYQYTVHEIYDDLGRVKDKKFYFWVSDKNIATRGRQLSLKAAASQLQQPNVAYGIMNNIVPANGYKPIHYTQYIAAGLNRFIKKDNTYKLRFTRDFTLREDPNGMNLKNVHTEWVLLREAQKTRIPRELWERLIDAACGQDLAGNQVPSAERVNYDALYGTSTKYGFEKGQALVDKSLAVESITYTILNTTVKYRNYSVGLGDTVQRIDFLDYSKSDEWFLTPESTRQILSEIWDNATPEHVNEIFFSVFHNALSKNYEFKNIIKTSMVSAHTIRFFDSREIAELDT